jgi:hypothetical protein
MENLENQEVSTDNTIKIFIAIGIVFSALNGLITLIKFLEEKEIARKQLEKSKQ